MKGRKPKPTKLLEMEKGKLYSDQRDRAELEPKPKAELLPRCPSRFNKAEKKWWRSYARILKNYNLFVIANQPGLDILASLRTIYENAMDTYRSADPLDTDYAKVASVQLGLALKLEPRIMQWQSSLAMSSTDLTKIGSLMLKAKKQKSELEGMMD